LYLPDGAAAVAAGRAALSDCPESERPIVEKMLNFVESLLADGQRQVWLRRKEFAGKDLAAAKWLMDLWN
jgi:hypothetical protein